MAEVYLQIKSKIMSTPSCSVDLSEMHHLLQKEYEELSHFIAARDAELVSLACDGIGTDDELLIHVLCNRTKSQLILANTYFVKNDKGSKTISERVNSETSGNYGKFMCAIVQPHDVMYGQCYIFD